MPRAKEQFEEIRLEAIRKIRVAGLELFARKGFAGTNIKEIATSAQISLGLMYHYYRSKDELYLALANEAMDLSITLLTSLKKRPASAREKVEGFIQAFLTGVHKHPEIYYFIIIGQQFETNDVAENELLNGRKLESMKILADIIRSGQKKDEIVTGDPLQLAVILVAATQGLATFRMTFGNKFKMPEVSVLLNMLVKERLK